MFLSINFTNSNVHLLKVLSAFRPPSNLRVTNVETDYAELWLDIETAEPNFPFQMLDFTVSSSVPGFERSQYVGW